MAENENAPSANSKGFPVLTKMLTPENEEAFFSDAVEDYRFGYMDAVGRIIPALETMLDNSKSFDELKNELRTFVTNQKNFSVFMENKYDQEPLDAETLKWIEEAGQRRRNRNSANTLPSPKSPPHL